MNLKKKTRQFFLFELLALIVSMLFLFSCEEGSDISIGSNPETEVSLQYQKLNADDPAIYKVKSSEVNRRNSAWLLGYADGGVWLKKNVSLLLNAGDTEEMNIYIEVRHDELDKELLELNDEEANYWERSWDYNSTAKEIERFYKKENISIHFDHTYILEPQMLEIEKVQKVLVEGEEKTFVKIRFSGEAFGFYDPYKEREGICIKEGYFAGVIE